MHHRAARQLVERMGGVADDEVTARTTMLVVGGGSTARRGSAARSEAGSPKLRKAEEVNAATPGRVRIVAEDEFCRLGGLPTAEALDRRYYSLRRIRRRYPRIRQNHIRCLESGRWSAPRLAPTSIATTDSRACGRSAASATASSGAGRSGRCCGSSRRRATVS